MADSTVPLGLFLSHDDGNNGMKRTSLDGSTVSSFDNDAYFRPKSPKGVEKNNNRDDNPPGQSIADLYRRTHPDEDSDGTDLSELDFQLMATDFLQYLDNKENRDAESPPKTDSLPTPKRHQQQHQQRTAPLTPSRKALALLNHLPSPSPRTPKTPNGAARLGRKTPRAKRSDSKVFSFGDEDDDDNNENNNNNSENVVCEYSPSPTQPPSDTFGFSKVQATPGGADTFQRLSPENNDPYEWAYAIWRKKGIMGRSSRGTPQPEAIPAPAVEETTNPSPQAHTGELLGEAQDDVDHNDEEHDNDNEEEEEEEFFDWDLSPMHAPTLTRGAARAEEFSRAASGNFGTLLKLWREHALKSPEVYEIDRSHPRPVFTAAASPSPASPSPAKQSRPEEPRQNLQQTFAKEDKMEQSEVGRLPIREISVDRHRGNMGCICSKSIFSGNDDLVEFFLPKLGMACTCGKEEQSGSFLVPGLESEPTAIEHILRPWQVDFLKSFGICKGDQMVKAHHRSANILAKALRKWRKEHGMLRVTTVSCGMALHIWSRTCKAYVRSVRRQLAQGVDTIRPPNTLAVLSELLGGANSNKEQSSSSSSSNRRRSKKELIEAESQMEI